MKRLLSLALVALIGGALAGCEASGRVGDDDADAEYRRTTTIRDTDPDVTRTETKTEIRREVEIDD